MDGSKEIWNSNKSNLNKVRNPLAPTMFSPSTFSSLAIIGGHRNNCSKVSAKIVYCIHYFTHLNMPEVGEKKVTIQFFTLVVS